MNDITRRAVLGAAATGGAGALLAPGRAEAAAARTSFDPRVAGTWLTGRFRYDFSVGSPYRANLRGPYPLTLGTVTSRTADGVVLDRGVARVRIAGRYVPQAVTTCWYLVPQIHSYRLDRDPRRLAVIEATAADMDAQATTDAAGARWFPHTGVYKGGLLEQSSPTWYSGMTQGMALSTYWMLWEATGSARWRDVAMRTARSYRHYRDLAAANPSPWFVGYERGPGGTLGTFFEEYPSLRGSKNAHVANGFVYSLWGLYDHYRITRDAESKVLLDRGLETLRRSFPRYRVPHGPSWYAITEWGHGAWGRPANYHYGVARILQTTGRITRCGAFTAQGRTLLADHNPRA